MIKEIAVCDKCRMEIDVQGSKTEIYDGTYDFKVTPVDLCIPCTKEFVNWLEGETIDKQTKPQE